MDVIQEIDNIVSSSMHSSKNKPIFFYSDLISSCLLSQAGVVYLSYYPFFSFLSISVFIISLMFFLRSSLFIHEVFHQKRRHIFGPLIFNLLFGFINRSPAYIEDHHYFHHKLETYGTKSDPDYDLYYKSPVKSILLLMLSFIITPVILLVRFGIIPLFYPILSDRIKLLLYKKASTITTRADYVRMATDENEVKRAQFQDICCSIYTLATFLLILFQLLPVKYLFLQYVYSFLILQLNFVRALGSHYYQSEFEKSSKVGMLEDTLTAGNTVVGNLLFAVGLNYHALHHMYPSIPYYHFRAIHNELMSKLTDRNNPYLANIFPRILRKIIDCMRHAPKKA